MSKIEVAGDPLTNQFKPNYKVKCENCDQVPTVDVVTIKGETVSQMELCGPCCFGEAAAIDPANW